MKTLISALLFFLTFSMLAQRIEKDIALGKEYSSYVEEAIGVYNHPELTNYVKSVGDKLTARLDDPLFDYSYTILATSEPNAFSIPGGHLYITTGMFPFLESEDELACIMAHEIIHAEERHVIKSNRRGILPGILQIPGAIIGALVDENLGNAINSPFRQIGALTHASYNRKQETEADVEGVKIAVKAGYDPDALIQILARLGKFEEISSGEAEAEDRYAGHPMTAERVAKIEAVGEGLEKTTGSPIAVDFLQKFDGALAGNDPNRGVFIEETYLNPADSFKITFPEGWEGGFMQNVVYSTQEETGELMRVVYEKSELNPTYAANEFIRQLDPVLRESVLGSEAATVDGELAHIIAFREKFDGKTYYGFKTWLRHESFLFSFLASSPNQDLSKMEEVLYSLVKLSEEDRDRIEFPMLRLVEAQKNETINSLVERTKTVLTEKVTLLINEKTEGEAFNEGERVKVVVKERL